MTKIVCWQLVCVKKKPESAELGLSVVTTLALKTPPARGSCAARLL